MIQPHDWSYAELLGDSVLADYPRRTILLTSEPGIGKSRVLGPGGPVLHYSLPFGDIANRLFDGFAGTEAPVQQVLLELRDALDRPNLP